MPYVFLGLIPKHAMPATFSWFDIAFKRLSILSLFTRRITISTSLVTGYLMEASAASLGKPEIMVSATGFVAGCGLDVIKGRGGWLGILGTSR